VPYLVSANTRSSSSRIGRTAAAAGRLTRDLEILKKKENPISFQSSFEDGMEQNETSVSLAMTSSANNTDAAIKSLIPAEIYMISACKDE
jgi:hypothetical protein